MWEKAERVMHNLKSENAMIVVIYTIISFSAIVVGHYTAVKYFIEIMPWAVNVTLTIFNLLLAILLVSLGEIALYFLYITLESKPSKIPLIILPSIVLIVIGVPTVWVNKNLDYWGIGFTIVTAFFVFVFQFITYYEEIPSQSKESLKLMHQRYLQFLTIFMLIIITGGITAIVWQMGSFYKPVYDYPALIMVKKMALSMIQVVCIVLLGIFLAFFAFFNKLREIEQKCKNG